MTKKMFRRAKPNERYKEEINIVLFNTLPDVLYVRDLIEIGIFSGDYQAATYRDNGEGPRHHKVGKTWIYAKEDVRDFINKLPDRPTEDKK